jgi:hypothetical protein
MNGINQIRTRGNKVDQETSGGSGKRKLFNCNFNRGQERILALLNLVSVGNTHNYRTGGSIDPDTSVVIPTHEIDFILTGVYGQPIHQGFSRPISGIDGFQVLPRNKIGTWKRCCQ